MTQIRQDYVHHVGVTATRRAYDGSDETTHYLWKGTSAQIAERVSRDIKSQLDGGQTHRVELTPIHPAYIADLTVLS